MLLLKHVERRFSNGCSNWISKDLEKQILHFREVLGLVCLSWWFLRSAFNGTRLLLLLLLLGSEVFKRDGIVWLLSILDSALSLIQVQQLHELCWILRQIQASRGFQANVYEVLSPYCSLNTYWPESSSCRFWSADSISSCLDCCCNL
jgi:hypothetical protein